MKATKIYYKKLFNLGNYENEEIGIELEIEEGEKAADVLEHAKKFVNMHNEASQFIDEYEQAKRIVAHPDNYTYKQVKDAERFLQTFEKDYEPPF